MRLIIMPFIFELLYNIEYSFLSWIFHLFLEHSSITLTDHHRHNAAIVETILTAFPLTASPPDCGFYLMEDSIIMITIYTL